MLRILTVSLATIAHVASANPSPNLVSCKMMNIGGVAQCAIDPIEILPQQIYESKVEIQSIFACGPGDSAALRIGAKSDTAQIYFELGKTTKSTLTGTGPFKVFDENPIEFFGNIFVAGCSLTAEVLSVAPSAATIAHWAAKQAELDVEITKVTSARDAFSALSVYAPAFELIEQVNTTLLSDLGANATLRAQLEKGAKLRDLLEDLTLSTVEISDPSTSGPSHTVSKDEKKLILEILNFVDQLPPIATCTGPAASSTCKAASLDNYLSDAQKKTLLELAKYQKAVSEASKNETLFANDLIQLNQNQIELCKISNLWITWKVIPEGCK
jgi:hypothetical protein